MRRLTPRLLGLALLALLLYLLADTGQLFFTLNPTM